MLKLFLTTVLLLLTGFCASAQILNISKRDITTDSANYYMGWFDFWFEIDNRSPLPNEAASFLGVEGSLDLVRVSKRNVYFLIGQINHYRATGDPVISTGYAHFRANFERKKKLSYELFIQELFDHSRFLDLRGLGGGGVKYRIVAKPKLEVNLGVGAMYEHEKWRNLVEDGSHTINNLWKSTNYVRLNMVASENANISFATYYQVGYDAGISDFRHRISSQGQLEFMFNERFSFLIEGSFSFEDKPVLAINRTVYSIKNGIRVNF